MPSATCRARRSQPRAEYEPPFSEVAKEYVNDWKRQKGLKPSNTEQQKKATFALFAGFWVDRPIRGIRETDAVAFHDVLKRLDPRWARSSAAKSMKWDALLRAFGNHETGLSPATMNRHMATLKSLWDWARKRGHCSGDNSFDGHHTKLTAKNVVGYLPWEEDELVHLLTPGPKRRDLHEIIMVALHTPHQKSSKSSGSGPRASPIQGTPHALQDHPQHPAGEQMVPRAPSCVACLDLHQRPEQDRRKNA